MHLLADRRGVDRSEMDIPHYFHVGWSKAAVTRGLVAATAGGLCCLIYLLPVTQRLGVSNGVHGLTLAVVVVLMVRAARQSDATIVRSRWLFAAALVASVLGAAVAAGYAVAAGTLPVPSAADAITPLWFVLAAAGFCYVPRREDGRTGNPRIALDWFVGASALFYVSWLWVFLPVLNGHPASHLETATQLMYPLGDTMMAALVLAILPHARGDVRRLLNFVAAGVLLIAVTDSGAARSWAAHGKTVFGWPDIVVELAMVLLAFGALAKPQQLSGDRRLSTYLPFVPTVIAVMVGIAHVAAGNVLTMNDVVPGSVMIVALLARQVLNSRDLTAAAAAHERAALIDELTGLGSRGAFLRPIGEQVRTPGLPPVAVLLIDLDGFKEINDTFGHHVGDEVLVSFSRVLSTHAAGHEVARLGGDEFAVACFGDDAERAAYEIATQMEHTHDIDTIREGKLNINCSIGLAVTRGGDRGTTEVLRRADLAMYAAKADPAHRFAVFEQQLEDVSSRKNLLAAALHGAAERGEMQLAFQPLYRLADRRLLGAEALLRWRHQTFGWVSPEEFIPLAEETGQIVALGNWVLNEAVQQLASWDRDGRYLHRLLINVSARQLTDELVGQVAGALSTHGVPAERVTLEVTETHLADVKVGTILDKLHELGVGLALDDFGTGYSSLSQLARLPVDVLKIDRQFIADLDRDSGPDILRAIVDLARTLKMVTLAEGIETEEQRQLVIGCGVAYGQGFLLARPMAAERVATRLPSVRPQVHVRTGPISTLAVRSFDKVSNVFPTQPAFGVGEPAVKAS